MKKRKDLIRFEDINKKNRSVIGTERFHMIVERELHKLD
jgi:hypothetical protein